MFKIACICDILRLCTGRLVAGPLGPRRPKGCRGIKMVGLKFITILMGIVVNVKVLFKGYIYDVRVGTMSMFVFF